MKKSSHLAYMQKHYFSAANYSTLHEMLYSVSKKYGDKPAFILKDSTGYPYTVSYFNLLKDVESVGISLIKNGFMNKKIELISNLLIIRKSL